MAVSFGDAALAFAGGAAKQYNEIEKEKRDSQTRMKERAQQLLDDVTVKQAETEYMNETKRYYETEDLYKKIEASGGVNSPAGQELLVGHYGLDFKRTVLNGTFGTLQLPPRGKSPVPLTNRVARLAASDYTPEAHAVGTRVRNGRSGNYFTEDGEAIPRGVVPKADGTVDPKDVIESRGWKTSDPALFITDGSNYTPEDWKEIGKLMLGEEADLQFLQTDRGIFVGDKNTGEVKLAEGFGSGEGTGDASPAGKLAADLEKWTSRAEKDPTDTVAQAAVASITRQLEQLGVKEEPAFVESATYYRNNETGEVIRPTRKGNDFFHGETKLNIQQWTPVTDETATQKVEADRKKLDRLDSRARALGNLEAGLNDYKNTVTAGTTGATGFVIDATSAVYTGIVGFAELTGVADPVTPAEREDLFKKAGLGRDSWISGDMQALRGLNVQQRKQLVYSLAGILKEDADIARTSVADVDRAADMIKDLGAEDRGVGALRGLEQALAIKKASVYQGLYQTDGMNPRRRAEAGINLLKTTIFQNDDAAWEAKKGSISVNPNTGHIQMRMEDGTNMSLDNIIMEYGSGGQLRPILDVQANY